MCDNNDRQIMYRERGKPILAVEADVYKDEVSVWCHVNEVTPFTEVLNAFEALKVRIAEIIRDRTKCPYCEERGEE